MRGTAALPRGPAFPHQPGRAKENSPAIHRWVFRAAGSKSRQGRKNRFVAHRFFRPSGAWVAVVPLVPAINRWAIFGRP